MRGIVKRFPGVLANDHVDFDVESGEVHALLGENGAGKSTLMRQLYGLYQPDEGQILIDGQPAVFRSPADAIRAGIGMIHQHFMLVSTLTVAENVALGLKSSREPMMDLDQVSARIRSLSQAYGLKVEPNVPVWQLAVGEQQRVERITPRTDLRQRLRLSRVAELGRVRSQYLANHLPRQPKLPADRLDRLLLNEIRAADLRDRFHYQHPRPGPHVPHGSHCGPRAPGGPFGRRSPRKRGPYSALTHFR